MHEHEWHYAELLKAREEHETSRLEAGHAQRVFEAAKRRFDRAAERLANAEAELKGWLDRAQETRTVVANVLDAGVVTKALPAKKEE